MDIFFFEKFFENLEVHKFVPKISEKFYWKLYWKFGCNQIHLETEKSFVSHLLRYNWNLSGKILHLFTYLVLYAPFDDLCFVSINININISISAIQNINIITIVLHCLYYLCCLYFLWNPRKILSIICSFISKIIGAEGYVECRGYAAN